MGKTATFRFKWTQVSPDPHTVAMRNTLEPVDIFVEIEVPKERKYFANGNDIGEHREMEIKAELIPDVESPGAEPTPILNVEGMKYVIEQLSLSNSEFEPEIENDLDDEDWDSDTVSSADDIELGDDDDLNDEDFGDDEEEW